MPYYRPRMVAELAIPEVAGNINAAANQQPDGFLILTSLPVLSARLLRNDPNHADELTVTFDYRTIPVDPRYLRNAIIKLWMANADEQGNWAPSDDNMRFIGIATKPARRASGNDAPTFECTFLDYTTLYIGMKPFPTAGVPDLSQTLSDAWRRICDNVGWFNPDTKRIDSSVTSLRENLVFNPPSAATVRLGDAVSARFAKLGKVVVKPGTDAWAVWQQCCGMCAVISYIYLDQCIVTTANNFFHPQTSAIFTWGKNMLSFHESRNPLMNKGICLSSFDPLGGRSIEAFWPPIGDVSVRKKRLAAHTRKVQPPSAANEEREYFPISGVTDLAKLIEIAVRVYEERSRQEIEGVFTTKDMVALDAGGRKIDVLSMSPGDGVIVGFDPDMLAQIYSLDSFDAKVAFLVRRGINENTAYLMVNSTSDLFQRPAEFLVKSLTIQFDSTPEGGDWSAEIHYCNRIDARADAKTSQ